VQQMVEVDKIIPWGIFDQQTDVHVFILYATKLAEASTRNPLSAPIGITSRHEGAREPGMAESATVSSYFDISVGAVVPHRHPEIGPVRPFATARELPAWQAVSEVLTMRRFTGRCETPPFVAVRRTSRPGQSPRARATLINGEDEVAVDNHLIIARPLDGTNQKCIELLQLLQDPATTAWLDDRYRCRHLPVEAIGKLPWLVEVGTSHA